MNLQMLGHNLLVRLNEETAETKSGIVLPKSHQRNQALGDVISTGPGNMLKDGTIRPLQIKPGEQILFDPETSTELNRDVAPDDSKYYIVQHNLVIALVETN